MFNLREEFEPLKMKDAEKINEHNDKILKLVNQIGLLEGDLTNASIV